MKPSVCLSLTIFLAAIGSADAAEPDTAENPIFGQTMPSLDGAPVDLSKYQGKVLLIVNTASQCGATPQYADLQKLHERYKDRGLVVLGFPCNQFGAQEPGSDSEIAEFCQENYGVSFDMFSKIDVNKDGAAPLFKYLTSTETGLDDTGAVKWNFEKFLISRDGKPVARFRTSVNPDSAQVTQAIDSALKE